MLKEYQEKIGQFENIWGVLAFGKLVC